MKNTTRNTIGRQDSYYVNHNMFKGQKRKDSKETRKKEKITIVKL